MTKKIYLEPLQKCPRPLHFTLLLAYQKKFIINQMSLLYVQKICQRFDKRNVRKTYFQFKKARRERKCFDDFLAELKLLSRNCNYCERCYPGLLQDRIVAGIQSDVLRKKLLSEKKLKVENAINICRASEETSEGKESLKNGLQSEVAWLKGKVKYGKTSGKW